MTPGFVVKGQVRGFVKRGLFAFAAIGPEHDAEEGDQHHDGPKRLQIRVKVMLFPRLQFDAKALQVGDQGIEFGLAFEHLRALFSISASV